MFYVPHESENKKKVINMNDWDFADFQEDLKKAVKKLHNDKASRVETYMDFEDKEYKIVIEEVKQNGDNKDEQNTKPYSSCELKDIVNPW